MHYCNLLRMKKMNKIKKTLSVLFTTLMIIMTVPFSVSAVENTTNDTILYPGDQITITYSFAKDIPAGCPCYLFRSNYPLTKVKYKSFENHWALQPMVVTNTTEEHKNVSVSAFTAYGPKVKSGEKIISLVYDVIEKTKLSNLDFSIIELQLGDNNLVDYSGDLSYLSYNITLKVNVTEPDVKPTMPTFAPEPSVEYPLGDVDKDGVVTVMDATLVQKYIVGMETLSTEQKQLADVNRDNRINVIDATCIQSYVVGASTFPSTSPSNTNATEPVETQPTTTKPVKVKATKPVEATTNKVAQPTTIEKTTAQVVAATASTTTPSNISSNNNNSFNDKYAKEVLNIVNKERTKNGLEPLVSNNTLNEIAKTRATEIVTSFSHSRPDGSSCFSAIDKYNIRWRTLGENIAGGYKSPSSVMNAWMNSDGHRANILNKDFESVGIACYNYNGTYYWVQFFMGEFHK